MRLNGYVDASDVPMLFDALNQVDQRRRMSRLRQLAVLGLMVESAQAAAVEQGQEARSPAVTFRPKMSQPVAPVDSGLRTPGRTVEVAPATPQTEASDEKQTCGVTAQQTEQSSVLPSNAAPARRFNRSMLDRIDTDIMK